MQSLSIRLLLGILFLFQTNAWAQSTSISAPGPEAQKILDKIQPLDGQFDLSTLVTPGYENYYTLKQVTVDSLPNGDLAQLVPVLDDPSGKLVVEYRITPQGLKNPAVLLETYTRLQQITNSAYGFNGPYPWIEALTNAEAGSVLSRERLARMDTDGANYAQKFLAAYAAPDSFGLPLQDPNLKDYFDLRLKEAQAKWEPLKKSADTELRRRERIQEQMRVTYEKLEAAPVKLNDLILKNDRAGVRNLLNTYLPWELMEPLEARSWHQWVDAIDTPDPARVKIVFRGMDGYPVLKNVEGTNPGMVSTVLAKNQGNYNRRLRSLTTMREKIGSPQYQLDPINYDYEGKTKLPRNNATLLNIMSQHAGDPMGSPFISVSDNATAQSFGYSERIALKIDERRLVPNLMAFGFSEKERLIPLIIFPDEVVYYQGKANGFDGEIDNEAFFKKVEENLGRPLAEEEKVWSIDPDEYKKYAFEKTKADLLEPPVSSLKGLPGCAVPGGASKTLDDLLTKK